MRKIVEGHEVRSVEIDPERGPLVELAFTLYTTGDWTLTRLTEHLRERGLIARPTPKQGGRALSRATVHKVLTNPYYMGVVEYAGKRVVGRHEPLAQARPLSARTRLLRCLRRAAAVRPPPRPQRRDVRLLLVRQPESAAPAAQLLEPALRRRGGRARR